MSEVELRAAGCTLLPKRILRCRLEYGLKSLYYKAFAETKPVAHLYLARGIMLTEFAAMVAIDWADQNHAWAMQAGTSKTDTGAIDHTPEAIDVWPSVPTWLRHSSFPNYSAGRERFSYT